MDEEKTNLTVFDDGMRLVTRHIRDYYETTIRLMIDAGSRDEIFGGHRRGVAHFVEHMLSRGSNNYPKPSQVSKVIARLGGTIKATTDFHAIFLSAAVPPDALPVALHVLGDMVGRPLFPVEPLKRETRRIENEWLEGEMDPPKMRFLNAVQVSSGHAALLNPVLGDQQSINAIKREDLVRFHKEKITAGNIVIGVEGDLAKHDVVDLARMHIDLPPGKRPSTEPPHYVGGDDRLSRRERGTRVMLAFPMPPRKDINASAAHVMLAKLLGGSEADSFYDKMSDKEGLVYSVEAVRRPFPDYGLFTVGFTSFPYNVHRSVELIAAQIKSLSQHVDPEAFEIQRKADLCARTAKLKETTVGVDKLTDDVAVYGRVLPRQYFYDLQAEVTIGDIRDAARSLLNAVQQKPVTFVADGNLKGLPSVREVRRVFHAAGQEANQMSYGRKVHMPIDISHIWGGLRTLVR